MGKTDQNDQLPASALDMEESVLGAILLQSSAPEVVRVTAALRPEHFYKPEHNATYSAIRSILQRKDPIDLRTVARELRGKIDMPASFIGELSNKVSNTTNIETHAKVIVECYIKRAIYRIGASLSKEAFSDEADALEILERSIGDLTALQTNSIVRSQESIIKEQWNERIVKDEPDPEDILIRIDGAEMCSPGNHSMVTGQKKSRKSLFVVQEIAWFFEQNPGAAGSQVCIFDTEQGKVHVWKYFDRIKRATGKEVTMFRLRGMGYKDRRNFIEHTITFWPSQTRIVVIDGIRDLVSNINDPDECTELIEWLESLILRHGVHVINVLHLNKTDGNARGHLGSELQNKAEASIKIELDKDTGHSIVSCESSREKGFQDFAFQHSPTGLPELVDLPSSGTKLNTDERRNRLTVVFADGTLKYSHLLTNIEEHFQISQRKGRQLIAEFVRMGWIVKNGPDRSPNTVYKLMVSTSTNGHDPEENPAQLNLMPLPDDVELPF